MMWAAPRQPETAAFQEKVTLLLDLKRVHRLVPSFPWGEEPMYFLCAYPDEDGVCSFHLTVRAKDLARWVFP